MVDRDDVVFNRVPLTATGKKTIRQRYLDHLGRSADEVTRRALFR